MKLVYIAESLQEILVSSAAIDRQLIITDEEGCVLYVLNKAAVKSNDIVEGCFLDEASNGLNGLGKALADKKMVKMKGKSHSQAKFKHSISLGIPIIYEDKIIGCVGYILPIGDLDPVQAAILENVIHTSLRAAGKMLESRESLDELHLLKKYFSSMDNNQCNMIVNINLDIIQLNRQAEILLGISKDDLMGHSLYELIDVMPKNVFNSSPDSCFNGQVVMHTSAGKKPFLIDINPVSSEGERLVGWHLSFAPSVMASAKDSKISPRKYEFKDIIGQNKEFIKLLALANAVAKSPSNVLITGESGTGKELFAQAVHYASHCAQGPFVAINCAAIPKELIETELFGYLEGAFTGAHKKGMKGKFIQADEGTLFLDEIGDMPMELQAKLLRVLQERTVTPLGGAKAVPVNIRIISATNQNLEKLIAENKFRSDLFYRLNVINLCIPSLRDRKDDIPLLVRHFINTLNKKLNKNIKGISSEAVNSLMSYNWPGNIRELENTIETAVNLAEDYIEQEHISFLVSHSRPNTPVKIESGQTAGTLEQVEVNEIIRALNQCNGNVGQAALVLNIGRATLYRKIKKYQITSHVRSE